MNEEKDKNIAHRAALPFHAIRYLPRLITFAYERRLPPYAELFVRCVCAVERECFSSHLIQGGGIELRGFHTQSASVLFLVPYRALD